MSFEKFIGKRCSRNFIEKDTIRFGDYGHLTLSKIATSFFKDFQYVDIFIDRELKAIKIIAGTSRRVCRYKNSNTSTVYVSKSFDMPKGLYERENDYYKLINPLLS